MTRTVKEYLWGYEDPLLHSLKTLLPKIVRDDQISVFASVVNEAQYETWLIEDGVGRDENQKERVEHVGWIERFNFTTELTTWFDQYSNMINGTDSTIWHPRVDKNQRIYSFMNDICRSVYVEFNETVKSSYEIEMLRYKLPSSLFSNSPENQGFCPREVLRNGTILVKCLPDGLFYLTPCLKRNLIKIIAKKSIFSSRIFSQRKLVEHSDSDRCIESTFSFRRSISSTIRPRFTAE